MTPANSLKSVVLPVNAFIFTLRFGLIRIFASFDIGNRPLYLCRKGGTAFLSNL